MAQQTTDARLGELRTAGKALAGAFATNSVLPKFPLTNAPRDRTEAFHVQDAFNETVDDATTGWKLGATAVELYDNARHDGATMGRVFGHRDFANHSHLPAKLFAGAKVECEFGFLALQDVSADVLQGASDNPRAFVDGANPVFGLMPCAEFVGLRFQVDAQNPMQVLGDNAANVGLVRGELCTIFPSDIDFLTHAIGLSVDDGPNLPQLMGDQRCQPLDALVEGLIKLAARDIYIACGQIITTGSSTVPHILYAGNRVKIDYGILGQIEFSLDEG